MVFSSTKKTNTFLSAKTFKSEMILPIPSHKQPLTLVFTLEATAPVSLGITAYDPRYRHTYYFRRKVKLTKGQTREIALALPVTPERLEVSLFNKATLCDQGFRVLDLKCQKLELAPLWRTPEQHRFMDFAIGFAQKAGYIPTGFYDSPKGEFLFQYVPTITNSQGKELVTPARTSRAMPRVQISQRLFKGFTIPVRVAILAHEGCHWFLNTRSQKQADLCGIRHYLEYGFPKIEAVYAATKIFGMHPSRVGLAQVERTKDIIKTIARYSQSR